MFSKKKVGELVKKFLVILGIFFTFFILYFLQANFFTWFTIGGDNAKPICYFYFIYRTIYRKKIGTRLWYSFWYLFRLFSRKIDWNIRSYARNHWFLAEYVDKNFSKDSRITMMLIVIVSTLFYETGYYIFQIIRWSIPIEILPFIKILAIETLFNVILVIILYPLLQKVGYWVEGIFKNQNVLTRYF